MFNLSLAILSLGLTFYNGYRDVNGLPKDILAGVIAIIAAALLISRGM